MLSIVYFFQYQHISKVIQAVEHLGWGGITALGYFDQHL
jgi:hypothetical protein